MLASISPLGERARHNRWWLTAGGFAAGALAGGAAAGGLLGGAGRGATALLPALRGPARGWPTVAAATVAVVAGAVDLWAPRRVPTTRRQVDEDWLDRYRGWVYGLGYGAQLGTGVATVVTTATVYAWMAAAVLTRSVAAGATIGLLFGAARAVPLAAVARADDPRRLRAVLVRLTAWAPRGRLFAAGASVTVGAAALASVRV
jgi:hypothetical protein